jgi:V/A-type H+-transporting ATPase subunit D
MRQGYEFLDEKRMLLATEMLRQLRDYQRVSERLMSETKAAADALAAAVERHGLDDLEVYPASAPPPPPPENERILFLGITMLTAVAPQQSNAPEPVAVDPSPEAKACRAAFERLLWTAADIGVRAGNLHRLAREYRRTERRAKALEKILLPEVEDAIKAVNEQLDTMDREETIRTRWSSRMRDAG